MNNENMDNQLGLITQLKSVWPVLAGIVVATFVLIVTFYSEIDKIKTHFDTRLTASNDQHQEAHEGLYSKRDRKSVV